MAAAILTRVSHALRPMVDAVIHRASGLFALHDARIGPNYDPVWFDREHWRRHGAPLGSTQERGAVLRLDRGPESWVLRHYHRGGFVARFVDDRYVWTGWERTRSVREWRLLQRLHGAGLPVPRPVAARAVREGPVYRADIVTEYLPDTRTLAAQLSDDGPDSECWAAVGATLRRFHDTGVEHRDLNAHNILIATEGGVFLVDFDNARLRAPGAWSQAGMARLERSLRKVARERGGRFDGEGWRVLDQAYRGGSRP